MLNGFVMYGTFGIQLLDKNDICLDISDLTGEGRAENFMSSPCSDLNYPARSNSRFSHVVTEVTDETVQVARNQGVSLSYYASSYFWDD